MKKLEERIGEVAQLRDAVNAYRAQKPAAAPPQSLTTEQCRQRHYPAPAARSIARPSELPDYPLNPNPPAEVPDFHTMQTAQIVARARQRKIAAQRPVKPIGETRLIKRVAE
jgi:hypothetical protein